MRFLSAAVSDLYYVLVFSFYSFGNLLKWVHTGEWLHK